MPPLPPTTQHLSARLTALSEQNKALGTLIQRLAKLDFTPGAVPQDSEEGDVRLELSAEIHESLKGIEEELELVRQEVEDYTSIGGNSNSRRESSRESERSRVAVLLARVTEDLRTSRTQYRKAQLTAKHNADRAKLAERTLLFSSLSSGTDTPTSLRARRAQQNSNLTENEVVAAASNDVTLALRRTHALLSNELSRSRFAQETLEQSTAALNELGERYTDLNSLLANSRALVGTLLKSNKSDTWYLETTLYILLATLIWLAFRRWFYGPLLYLVYIPLKWTFRLLFAIVPIGGGTALSSSSTSLIVKPSATGGIPERPVNVDAQGNPQGHYVRVGGGGRGYMAGDSDPSPDNSYSQYVGRMAEQQQQQQQQVGQGQPQEEQVPDHPQLREQNYEKDSEPVRRGDGTVLEESEKKRNPKKRMWEEKPGEAGRDVTQGKKDEL